jgi:Domain of unknown function (DUF4440)
MMLGLVESMMATSIYTHSVAESPRRWSPLQAKWLVLGVAAVFLLLAQTVSQNKNAPNEAAGKQQILDLEQERNRAIVNGDAAALERMTSDDYTFITLCGELRTKAEIVQGFSSGSFH